MWERACPRWTSDIADRYVDLYASALARRTSDPVAEDPVEAFAAQYLNRWPSSVEPAQRGEPLVDMALWATLEEDPTPDGPVVVALERDVSGGITMIIAGAVDGDDRVYVESFGFETRDEAYKFAAWAREQRPSSRVVASEQLHADPGAVSVSAKKRGNTEARVGLALLADLVAGRAVAHWCTPEHRPCRLTAQLGALRVATTPGGQLAVVAADRVDAVRAAAWAVGELVQNAPMEPRIY